MSADAGDTSMRAFAIYIYDDRRAVATLVFESFVDDASAQSRAKRYLTESPHRRTVELWEHDKLTYTVSRRSVGRTGA